MYKFFNKILYKDYKFKRIKRDDVNYSHYKAQTKELRNKKISSYSIYEVINIIKNSKYLKQAEEQLFSIDKSVLYKSYKHGENHNERVALYTFILSTLLELEWEDIKIALYASMYHDIGRSNDREDENHGKESASRLNELNIDLDEEELKILKLIVTCHSVDDKKFDSFYKEYGIKDYDRCKTLFTILKDADALDRTRLGWPRVRLDMLRIEYSLRLVKVAYEFFYNFKLIVNDDVIELKKCINHCRKNFKFKIRKIVDEQIETFFEIENSSFKLDNHGYKIGDTVILNENKYLHGVGKNSKAIDFIAKNGIISKDAVTGERNKHAFNYVSGFWKVKEEISLKDYIINYSGMDVRYEDNWCLVPYKGLDNFVEKMKEVDHFKWEAESSMEIRFMPSLSRDINQYGFILNISSDEAKSLIKNDVNGENYDVKVSKCFSSLLSDTKKLKKCTFVKRASYVIFGLNKCFIEGVLVGRKVEKNEKILKELKQKFPLCYICNLDGKVIVQ